MERYLEGEGHAINGNRKQGDCLQRIFILETKVRGKPQVHVMACVGFQYEKGNKVISFNQNEECDAKWGTGTVNIDVLMDTKSKCVHFGLFPPPFPGEESKRDTNFVLGASAAVLKVHFAETQGYKCRKTSKFYTKRFNDIQGGLKKNV